MVDHEIVLVHRVLPRVERGECRERREGDTARVEVRVHADLAMQQLLRRLVQVVVRRARVAKLRRPARARRRQLPRDDGREARPPRTVRRVLVEERRLLGHVPAQVSRLDDGAVEVEVAGIAEVLGGEPPAVRGRDLAKALAELDVVLVRQARLAEHEAAERVAKGDAERVPADCVQRRRS